MRRRDASASIPRTDLLKIDKDCVVNADLEGEYVATVLDTCGKHGVSVLWIKRTDTAHGFHYYIKIAAPIEAMIANNLQYLLGDDPKRVGFNEARIKSGLDEWNKLFERANCRMRTVYRTPSQVGYNVAYKLDVGDNPSFGYSCQGLSIIPNRFSTQVFILSFLEVLFEEEWLESILRFLTTCMRG